MCSASCLIVLYICVKFCENIERTGVHSRNGYFQYLLCSKGRNSKSRLTRVMVLCSESCLMVLYICKKFDNNILNGFQLTDRTRVHGRNDFVQRSKDNNSKNRQTSAMVYMFCTSSHSALHLCEVSLKYLIRYQSYGVENDGNLDGQIF